MVIKTQFKQKTGNHKQFNNRLETASNYRRVLWQRHFQYVWSAKFGA
jgi:hypothetical protein